MTLPPQRDEDIARVSVVPTVWQRVKGSWFGGFLRRTDRPLYFIIPSALIASLVTYCVAPRVNESFEKNRRESELIISQVDELNDKTDRVLKELAVFMQSADADGFVDIGKRSEALSALTTLQWHSIELKTLPTSDDMSLDLDSYQASVKNLAQELRNVNTVDDIDAAEDTIKTFALESAKLNRRLYQQATQ